VGVLREADGQLVPVRPENQGMEAEQYWRVHPPPRRPRR
jgi:hypothetical protein